MVVGGYIPPLEASGLCLLRRRLHGYRQPAATTRPFAKRTQAGGFQRRDVSPVFRISVVLITRNQRSCLEQSLPVLQTQTGLSRPLEIVVADSGSTDGTQDLVRSLGATLVEIDGATFNYAHAYNAGIRVASGSRIVRLSGDAVPLGSRFVRDLVEPMLSDDSVAAAWGRQEIPAEIRNPVERAFERRMRPALQTTPRRHTRDITVLGSAMAFRRDLWERMPFDERLPQAEDYAWMHHWYPRGYAGVYVPAAVIRHGHDESLLRSLRRSVAQSVLQGLILLRRS